eukprot:15464713-Alexandrium_andersonii.AAC.1
MEAVVEGRRAAKRPPLPTTRRPPASAPGFDPEPRVPRPGKRLTSPGGPRRRPPARRAQPGGQGPPAPPRGPCLGQPQRAPGLPLPGWRWPSACSQPT